MSKRILLIGGNFSPEPTGIGKYNGEMMKWLAENGYDCTVITSYPYYPEWKVQPPYDKKKNWYTREKQGKLTVYRCPQYVPAKPTGKTRIMLDFSFAVSAFFRLLTLLPRKKYDVVITVVPPFHLGLLAVIYKKLRGAKVFYHIQDMQIEAARDLKMIASPKLINILFKMERYIFRQADMVGSISDGMMKKIQEKAKKDIFFFPNWVDVNKFHPIEERLLLKTEYGFAATDKIVLYSGAIGEKQGLESILQAAQALKEDRHLKFLICGSGPYKERLVMQAAEMGLENVIFFPLQPFERFNHFLNMADVHLVIQKANASDLVMPSKLTTILAVGGLALITANSGTSLHDLVSTHNMGILVDAENQAALNEGILRSVNEDVREIAGNGRAYAENYLSVSRIMGRFEEHVVVG
ncbi:WcaI family glycosyltransferase [Chitinophaga sancti]|uniref:Colanic acid biosynthesis glycosyl transferase WcaI n=1 Tax=Chitinophaga sancti TaxID=1004 RepID=A0A1K1QV42_9BACT|nr:WcaI family glycosyltransferase [Chitinophaga sancti]WQD61981.1 WcaI family glycosyltransferase [Chitinophaga sancti]WQG92450.1 WcaI family glycosyltransferase [Chitinophaga sancti]SFW63783.1 colanic acid biosynthesis glycosyl transferase WcaI [Chitinophaga sancti]